MSKRTRVRALSLLAALLSTAAVPSPAGDGAVQAAVPTFSAERQLVTVDAVVLEGDGKALPRLRREDFQVLENGKPQEILQFEAIEVPAAGTAGASGPVRVSSNVASSAPARGGRSFALVFDDLHCRPSSVPLVQAAVARFAREVLRDGDDVTLATTSGEIAWSTSIPEGHGDLVALVPRLRPQLGETSLDAMSDYEARQVVATDEDVWTRVVRRWQAAGVCFADCAQMVAMRAQQIWGEAAQRTQATLGTLQKLLRGMADRRRRKSLVVLSEGFLTEEGSREVQAVVEASRRANAGLYFVDARGLVALFGEEEAAKAGHRASGSAQSAQDRTRAAFDDDVGVSASVERIADETGGFSARHTNDIRTALGRIGEESRVYYRLGYQPSSGPANGKFRAIAVNVARDGVKVRARKGYYPGADAVEIGRPPANRREKEERAGAIRAELPVRVASFVFDEKSPGKARVMLLADLDPRALTVEKDAALLEAEIAIEPREGGPSLTRREKLKLEAKGHAGEAWLSTVRELELPAGVAQALVTVRDTRSGATGRVAHRFEVPDLGRVRLSTPILTDEVETASEPGARPRPLLTTRRSFAPAGRLYCQFEVYRPRQDRAASFSVSAGYVLNKDGQPQRWAQPAPISVAADGRAVRLIGMPLEGLPGGAYDLALVVEVAAVSGSRCTSRSRSSPALAPRWRG